MASWSAKQSGWRSRKAASNFELWVLPSLPCTYYSKAISDLSESPEIICKTNIVLVRMLFGIVRKVYFPQLRSETINTRIQSLSRQILSSYII